MPGPSHASTQEGTELRTQCVPRTQPAELCEDQEASQGRPHTTPTRQRRRPHGLARSRGGSRPTRPLPVIRVTPTPSLCSRTPALKNTQPILSTRSTFGSDHTTLRGTHQVMHLSASASAPQKKTKALQKRMNVKKGEGDNGEWGNLFLNWPAPAA